MLTGINWDRVLQKYDEYNPDYRRRYMDEELDDHEYDDKSEEEE